MNIDILNEKPKNRPHKWFYKKYIEFLATGKYPYLKDTCEYCRQSLPMLDDTQADNLETQMFLSAGIYRKKEQGRDLRKYYKQGWKHIKEAVNLQDKDKIKLLVVSDSCFGESTRLHNFKVFKAGDGTIYLMKPRATKKGIDLMSTFWQQINFNVGIAVFKVIN